jgi:hypothetical protein
VIPLIGYAPDVDSTTPGVLVDCASIIPTTRGMAGAPTPVSSTVTALSSAAVGAASLVKLDGTKRAFLGTNTKIWEAGTNLTDRTRLSGNYSLSGTNRWRFDQYGDVALAVNKDTTAQVTTNAEFADITGGPKADIIQVVGDFVMLFNTNESTYGDSPDRWFCGAIGTFNDWTPSIATQCASGRLLGIPGKIIAARRFGEAVWVSKEAGSYLGIYVGPPVIWDFGRRLPGDEGAISQESSVDVGASDNPVILFMGRTNFWRFDGARTLPIGNPLRETVFREFNRDYRHLTFSLHDRANSIVYWFYCSGSATTPNAGVAYNYRSDRWGRHDLTVEAVMEFAGAALTYADIGTYYGTYGSLPSSPYGDAFANNQPFVPTVINSSHRLQTLTGDAGPSSITTGDYGDDTALTLLTRVKPRYLRSPRSATMTNYYRSNLGDTLMQDQTVTQNRGRFDVLRDARWHRVRVDFTGPVELTGLTPDVVVTGDE